MSPRPFRHFGGPSRAANAFPYKKPSHQSRSNNRNSIIKPDLDLILNHESVGRTSGDYATHFSGATILPPFKIENRDATLFKTEIPIDDLRTASPIDEDNLQDKEGMPTRAEWEAVMESYLLGLHPSKREKALITHYMHGLIYRTLVDPDATRLGTPQFRFWARKMFQLVQDGDVLAITNGGRPVAVKENIYDILSMCHAESGHAGRDKTCKVLREYYTWIPKDLTASFVKACPTCKQKRSGEANLISERKIHSSDSAPLSKQLYLFKNDQSLAGPSQYSVERVEDFGQSSVLCFGGQPHSNSTASTSNGGLISRRDSCPSGDDGTSGNPLSPSPSFARIPLDGSFAIPSCISKSEFTLPPMNKSSNSSTIKAEQFPEYEHFSLPPLMQFLSQTDIDDELRIRREYGFTSRSRAPSPPADIPIDPELLAVCGPYTTMTFERSSPDRSFRGDDELAPAIGLQAPAPQQLCKRPSPPPLHILFPQCESTSVNYSIWEYQSADNSYSYGGESNSSALLSASTESTGVHTPSDKGASPGVYVSGNNLQQKDVRQDNVALIIVTEANMLQTPLYSPVPIKLEETAAMLELATAVS
ncbi:hypothetical protein EW145_g2439 [Phellinidium pouzarii]|uniref:Integrase zinc-binding domain-containing protein n=1 Tax=Phellinidium pouzarii TaxID=167371 RepID=A0A4S4LBA2_9AGAM|nr:hypothetical protein EW145_g2439 [Phellinidium pouzarii]